MLPKVVHDVTSAACRRVLHICCGAATAPDDTPYAARESVLTVVRESVCVDQRDVRMGELEAELAVSRALVAELEDRVAYLAGPGGRGPAERKRQAAPFRKTLKAEPERPGRRCGIRIGWCRCGCRRRARGAVAETQTPRQSNRAPAVSYPILTNSNPTLDYLSLARRERDFPITTARIT